jgi:hypothetical protein
LAAEAVTAMESAILGRRLRSRKIADDGGDDTVAAVTVWDQGHEFHMPLALDVKMKVFRGPTDRYWPSNWTAAEEAEKLASSV